MFDSSFVALLSPSNPTFCSSSDVQFESSLRQSASDPSLLSKFRRAEHHCGIHGCRTAPAEAPRGKADSTSQIDIKSFSTTSKGHSVCDPHDGSEGAATSAIDGYRHSSDLSAPLPRRCELECAKNLNSTVFSSRLACSARGRSQFHANLRCGTSRAHCGAGRDELDTGAGTGRPVPNRNRHHRGREIYSKHHVRYRRLLYVLSRLISYHRPAHYAGLYPVEDIPAFMITFDQ